MMRAALLATGVAACATAQAETKWDFSGFGSFGGAKTIGDESTSKSGYPEDDAFDPDWDSVLGVQASVMHPSGLGLTAQGVARGYSPQGDAPYQPVTEWFFASWNPNDSLRFRVGRLRTPLFMYSSSLEVGNGYPWATPPINVYGGAFSVASNHDGGDITYTDVRDGALITWQLLAGAIETSSYGIPTKIDNLRGISVSVELETVFFRYGFASYDLSVDNPALNSVQSILSVLSSASPVLGDVASGIDAHKSHYRAHEIGIRWEHDAYTVDAELLYAVPPDEKFGAEVSGAYVSVSRQTGDHSTYGVIGTTTVDLKNGVLANLAASKNDIPTGINPLVDSIRQELASRLDVYTGNFHSLTLGYRYDITEQWNVKTELQSMWFDEKFAYDAYTTPPDAPEQSQFYIARLVTDWVF